MTIFSKYRYKPTYNDIILAFTFKLIKLNFKTCNVFKHCVDNVASIVEKNIIYKSKGGKYKL